MPALQKIRHENRSASDRWPSREQGQRNREPKRPATQRDADDTAEQTLRARARHLAQPPPEATGGTEAEVLVFRLRDEQYAVEVGHLRSVQHGKDLTAIPCAPSFVAGMLNVHGDVVTVL